MFNDWVGSSSAGDIFSSTLKSWKNITLVGQNTNGRSGQSIFFHLENSDINVRLSFYKKDGKKFD
ncbi:S41 family peptidase [Thalassotalea piscium]|uniref:C-terminal processing protease CtpA/Prc n=1 Tax=Thalassotalea piscium TaxID=1230533 RepID=A0A7X0TT08_9GAMM|nr:S41 family peptidase [Thalassotalea piscium]MBB6542654.1 C-terminal processing protease CtpA/Prc [Thalassotalea piscium]